MSSIMLAFRLLAAMWQHFDLTDNGTSVPLFLTHNKQTHLVMAEKCCNVTKASYSVQEEIISNCDFNLFW